MSTEIVPVENIKKLSERANASEMTTIQRTPEDLMKEQEACNIIMNQILGDQSLILNEELRKNPKAVLSLIAYARDYGLHYQEVLQNAFVVKGKISFHTKFLIAQLRRIFNIMPFWTFDGDGESQRCTVRFLDLLRVDENGDNAVMKHVEYSMTMAEALASGFNGDPWKKQPQKMIRYRTVKNAIDTHWPGILGFDFDEGNDYTTTYSSSTRMEPENEVIPIIATEIPKSENLVKALLAPDDTVFVDFQKRLFEAETRDSLIRLWTEIKEAKTSLSDDEFDDLKNLYSARYKGTK